MKFAHMSDCHLGSWNNHPELERIPNRIFDKAIDICIDEKVDFILISGDLFHTSLPSIDVLSEAVESLKKAVESGINVYGILGSHDYSPSGKTMITVLEKAGLLKNVSPKQENGKLILKEFEEHGAKITGLFGKKGSLEVELFKDISVKPDPDKFNIFMLHSAIEEMKPSNLESMNAISLSDLPKNFDYYANGHVHEATWKEIEQNGKKSVIAFPGALFPCNFQELEKNPFGGFYIVSTENGIDVKRIDIKEYETILIEIDANGKTPQQVENNIIEKIENSDIDGKIVLIKASGILENGRVSDINFKNISDKCKSALAVKRNFSQLKTKEFEEVELKSGIGIEDLETDLIKEAVGQIDIGVDKDGEERLILDLMHALEKEKEEGETNAQFISRVIGDALKVLGLVNEK